MNGNGIRPATADPITSPPRDSRETKPPQMEMWGRILGMLIVVGGIIWTLSALVNNKADKSTVNVIKTDVEVIKSEQRMLIKYIAPSLKTGKE